MELKPGTHLQGGKYEIRSTLGRGGFGITYLAEHHMLNKLVCIKEFFPQAYYNRDSNSRSISLGSAGSAKMMEAYRNKFIKEARTIARLQHPNVISIYDVFEENNTAYYVMEYIEGDTLAGIVKRQGPMDEHTAREFIYMVADALDYIHKNNLLHLDVKPANIMVRSSDYHVVLIDFGLAKQYDSDGNQTSSTPVGVSQGYAPPEQYEEGAGNTFTPATDIYALGATYYYMTTGKVPPSSSVIMDGALPSLVQSLKPGVQRVILGSMQPSRRKRPANVDAFLALFSAQPSSPYMQSQETILATSQPQQPQQPQYQHYQQQQQQQYGHPYVQQPTMPKPQTYLGLSVTLVILSAISCSFLSLIFAVVAIVMAQKVEDMWVMQRDREAYLCSTRARNWFLASLICWVLSIILSIIVLVSI
ncbi:MAG: protein kinase [Alistipes sp.]|nr:protein kinase [Alistipes sp.]